MLNIYKYKLLNMNVQVVEFCNIWLTITDMAVVSLFRGSDMAVTSGQMKNLNNFLIVLSFSDDITGGGGPSYCTK